MIKHIILPPLRNFVRAVLVGLLLGGIAYIAIGIMTEREVARIRAVQAISHPYPIK